MSVDAAFAATQHNEEDVFRAQIYGLLSTLLSAPPDGDRLAALSQLGGDSTELGQAFTALAETASATTTETVEDEYHNLFIGMTRGEIVPYASYYLTGFLNEKPLAVLRDDLIALGIAQSPDILEPEDHIASLMEVMSGLALGDFQADFVEQRRFHQTHLAPWADRFFSDLEQAVSSAFYRPVARLGRIFLKIEAQAFGMTE